MYIIKEYNCARITNAREQGYHTKEGKSIPIISIIDAFGRTFKSTSLVATSGFKVIPCNELAPGSYTCTLSSGGKLLEVAKFIVLR